MASTQIKQTFNIPNSPFKMVVGEQGFDSSYPAGGEACDLSAELDQILWCRFEDKAGFRFELDKTNKKVLVKAAVRKFTATHDAASLAAGAARNDAVTVTGVASDDECVGWRGPDAQEADLDIQLARVSGADTITVRLANNDDTNAIDAASGTYTFYVVKKDGAAYEIPAATDLATLVGVTGFVAFGLKS